jgi:hypothetical protein
MILNKKMRLTKEQARKLINRSISVCPYFDTEFDMYLLTDEAFGQCPICGSESNIYIAIHPWYYILQCIGWEIEDTIMWEERQRRKQ